MSIRLQLLKVNIGEGGQQRFSMHAFIHKYVAQAVLESKGLRAIGVLGWGGWISAAPGWDAGRLAVPSENEMDGARLFYE